eukprot:686660-Rhodomonas_salina.1
MVLAVKRKRSQRAIASFPSCLPVGTLNVDVCVCVCVWQREEERERSSKEAKVSPSARRRGTCFQQDTPLPPCRQPQQPEHRVTQRSSNVFLPILSR